MLGTLRRRLKEAIEKAFTITGESVHLLVIDHHRSGVTCSVHRTAEGAEAALEAYMASYPEDAWSPEDFKEAKTFDERVVAYFSENEHESYVLDVVPLRD